jgi:type II secretory pathway pseudopilin PulG
MHLEGQAGQRGYALAALLIAVAVMSIVMSMLLPVWRHQMQREKEAELIFRGEQYARAIYLYQTKNGGQYPPSIEALVQGRYLRKKYKDPMTEDGEFLPLSVGANQPGPQGGPAGQRGTPQGGERGTGPGSGMQMGGNRGGQPSPGLGGSGPIGGVQGGGGIMTVRSKSKDASIRIYNGAGHYNEWHFQYNARGRGGPGQRGAPGGGPTQGRPGMGGPQPGGPGRGLGPGRGRGRGLGPGRGRGGGGRGREFAQTPGGGGGE